MKLITWARGVYLAGIALALVLFMPVAWFPLMPGKVAAAALFLLAAAVLWGVASLRESHPMPTAAWVFVLLPLSYLLSFAFSIDKALGVIGSGIDTDTLLFVTLCAAAGMLGAALLRSMRGASQFVRVLFWVLTGLALFQTLVLLFGLPGPFADRTVNLAGKWNDFGTLVMLLTSLVLIDIQFGGLNRNWRIGMWVLGAVSLWLLAMVNFSTAWGILLAVSLIVGVVSWAKARRVPWAPLIAAVVSVVFFFFGAALNAQLSSVIPVTSLEVRPGLQTTFDVITQSHGTSVQNTAVGMGPDTFGLMWLAHKPASVNQSQFWSLDFNVGYSTLMTAFGSAGFFGLLAWVLPLFALLYLWWRGRGANENRLLAGTIASVAALMWVVLALYVPSPDLILLAFAAAGAGIGMLAGANRISLRPLAIFTVALLVLAMVWVGFASARRALNEAYVAQASLALSANDLAGAQSLTNSALHTETTPESLRLAVAVGTAELQAIAAQPSASSSQQAFTDLLQQTIAAGQQAIAMDSLDYRSYVSLGQIYGLLAQNKVQGAYENAKAAFQAAQTYSPLNPTVPLLLAQLEATAGTLSGLQDSLKQSLTLKPDYTDAILFLARVDIARNDLASAINDTKVAAQTAPGVASIWLQLGLLYYANADTRNAIAPLEQALKIQPDYANAQYYLGLSYAAQGRNQEALALFQSIAQTNPGNAQVESIIQNLEAGKPPIATSTPSTTP